MAIQRLAERYAEAWAAHDLDAVIALHANDTVFDIHGDLASAAEGREAVRKLICQLFELAPDLRFDARRVYFGTGHMVFEYVMFGTARGAPFSCDGVDVISVRDGLVVRKDTYLDTSTYEGQLAEASRSS